MEEDSVSNKLLGDAGSMPNKKDMNHHVLSTDGNLMCW